MPTDELEQELRRALSGAATDMPDSDQTVQRLRQHHYRPGGGRRLAAGGTAIAVAGSVALGLGLSGTLSSGPPPAAALAAFTSITNAKNVTILSLARGPAIGAAQFRAGLRHGVPNVPHSAPYASSVVKANIYCASTPAEPAPGKLGVVRLEYVRSGSAVLELGGRHQPAGTKFAFDFAAGGRAVAVTLVKDHSYTCHSGFPAGRAHY